MNRINNYYKNNFHKISLTISFGVILLILNQLPYLNLYLTTTVIPIIFCVFVFLQYKIKSRINFLFAMFCLILSFPWLLVGSRVRVEPLGIIAFVAFAIATGQEIWGLIKDPKNN